MTGPFVSTFKDAPLAPGAEGVEKLPQISNQTWNATFQAHHIIPTWVANQYFDFFSDMRAAGLYKHDGFSQNGIYLPYDEADAGRAGMALHRGNDRPYRDFVRRIVEEIHTEYVTDLALPNADPDQALRNAHDDILHLQMYLKDGFVATVDGNTGNIIPRLFPNFRDTQLSGTRVPDLHALFGEIDLKSIRESRIYDSTYF